MRPDQWVDCHRSQPILELISELCWTRYLDTSSGCFGRTYCLSGRIRVQTCHCWRWASHCRQVLDQMWWCLWQHSMVGCIWTREIHKGWGVEAYGEGLGKLDLDEVGLQYKWLETWSCTYNTQRHVVGEVRVLPVGSETMEYACWQWYPPLIYLSSGWNNVKEGATVVNIFFWLFFCIWMHILSSILTFPEIVFPSRHGPKVLFWWFIFANLTRSCLLV